MISEMVSDPRLGMVMVPVAQRTESIHRAFFSRINPNKTLGFLNTWLVFSPEGVFTEPFFPALNQTKHLFF
jgi:hypothetical protein